MTNALGITSDGIRLAAEVKRLYREGEPLCVPEDSRILTPEHLINHHLDLRAFDDPLPLALVAARDPEAPMALAAAARLSPKVPERRPLAEVLGIVEEATRHDEVRRCIEMVSENAFHPQVLQEVRHQASAYIIRARRLYTDALRQNLRALLDGDIAPRLFVNQFFQLTERGNLRTDIRKKLVCSLLMSRTVRPGIKFLFLENFGRFPQAVRHAIVAQVVRAPDAPHLDAIKDELRFILAAETTASPTH